MTVVAKLAQIEVKDTMIDISIEFRENSILRWTVNLSVELETLDGLTNLQIANKLKNLGIALWTRYLKSLNEKSNGDWKRRDVFINQEYTVVP